MVACIFFRAHRVRQGSPGRMGGWWTGSGPGHVLIPMTSGGSAGVRGTGQAGWGRLVCELTGMVKEGGLPQALAGLEGGQDGSHSG